MKAEFLGQFSLRELKLFADGADIDHPVIYSYVHKIVKQEYACMN